MRGVGACVCHGSQGSHLYRQNNKGFAVVEAQGIRACYECVPEVSRLTSIWLCVVTPSSIYVIFGMQEETRKLAAMATWTLASNQGTWQNWLANQSVRLVSLSCQSSSGSNSPSVCLSIEQLSWQCSERLQSELIIWPLMCECENECLYHYLRRILLIEIKRMGIYIMKK